MEKTENYGLNKWAESDAIKRTDFNADNAKIDAAIKEQAIAIAAETASRKSAVEAETTARETLAAAVAKCGNCMIVYGSYKGAGTYGSDNPITLTFEHKPLLIAIMPKTASDSSVKGLVMVRESSMAYSYQEYYNSKCTVSWSDTSVSWYNGSSTDYQFSRSSTYYYVALLAADE